MVGLKGRIKKKLILLNLLILVGENIFELKDKIEKM